MIGVATVQLRDLPGWPPVWVRHDAAHEKTVNEKTAIDAYLRGEPGRLLEAEADVAALTLTIQHDGHTWLGLVPIEVTEARVLAITLFLRGHRGRSMSQVAALPLPE